MLFSCCWSQICSVRHKSISELRYWRCSWGSSSLQSVNHHFMDPAADPHSLQSHCVCSVKIYCNNNHNIMCHLFSYVSICRCEVSLSLWRTERDLHLLITAVCLRRVMDPCLILLNSVMIQWPLTPGEDKRVVMIELIYGSQKHTQCTQTELDTINTCAPTFTYIILYYIIYNS